MSHRAAPDATRVGVTCLVRTSLEPTWEEVQGLTGQEVVCVPAPITTSLVTPDFFGKLFLIVIECSTAYSKYHSYKFLASIFQNDHYLIKTKQNPKRIQNKTKPDLHFIYTSEAMGLSNLCTPGCVLKTPISSLINYLEDTGQRFIIIILNVFFSF